MGLADDDSIFEQDEETAARIKRLKSYEAKGRPLERCIGRLDYSFPDRSGSIEEVVAKEATDEQFDKILSEFKYAGKATINYHVLTGVSGYSFEELRKACTEQIPVGDEVEGETRTVYFADAEEYEGRLYLSFGYYDTATSEDPATGRATSEFIRQRCVAVVQNDIDLVEVRASDAKMAERVVLAIADALGIGRDANVFQPEFSVAFLSEFDDWVDKYTNLKLRLQERTDSTVDTISFTSGTDESGERKDVREDDRVTDELNEDGSEITMGYVELEDGSSAFHINRKNTRISFSRIEHEQKIAEITEVIHDALEETGGYQQHKLTEHEFVPE